MQKNAGLLIFNSLKQKKLIFNFFVIRNWKTLTDRRKRAKILADNSKLKATTPLMRPSFTGLFSVCESAKAIVFLKFPLKSGPSYAIVREKTDFTNRHVHVLSIFVQKKKLFSCAVLTREHCKTARERGKMLSKVSLHMYCPYSCAPSSEVGKINRLPRWV